MNAANVAMLRVTKLTDYGALLLTNMADGGSGADDGVHAAKDLATATHLPPPMVSKIMKLLAQHGLLISHRGPKGGYTLAKPPEQISLAEIIAALEGPIAITKCLNETDCPREFDAFCPIRGQWDFVNDAIRETLEGVTLWHMVMRRRGRRGVAAAALEAAPEVRSHCFSRCGNA